MRARQCSALMIVALLASTTSMTLAEQQPAATPVATSAPGAKPELAPKQAPVPVRIDIVLSRTKGTVKLSSLPYALHTISDGGSSLRVSSNVPVPNVNSGPQNYESIFSNIDCRLTPTDDGRYRLVLAMQDSSLGDPEGATAAQKVPVVRSYQINTTLILRDGQTTTFNVATDKVSGETIQAQVTVTAIK